MSRHCRRTARTTAAAPVSVHSTPPLPSQVTALTMLTATGCPAIRLFSPARGAVIGRLERRPPQPYQEKQEREEESRRGDDDKRDESAPGSGGTDMGPSLPAANCFTPIQCAFTVAPVRLPIEIGNASGNTGSRS